MQEDPATTVRVLLSAAGLAPPAEELEQMIRAYSALRAAADGLYTDEISRHPPTSLPTEPDSEPS